VTRHVAASSAAEPTLRTGRADDVAALLEFWRRAAHGESVSDDPDGVARLLARDRDAVLIAELDGAIVGTLIAGWDGWRCHLYRMAVDPGHRRRGIGRALLAAAERRFVALGGRRADAMVRVDNREAHPLHAAEGYAPQPDWARWIKPLL
jgi:ribosomal protein S18 acetylase RimI-like enzyme